MNKNKLLFLSFLISFNCFGRDLPEFDKFWTILVKLESGGKTNAIGDAGKAIGPAQIHKAYFLDAQEFNKELKKYNYSDCFDEKVSKLVVKSYLSRYCKEFTWEEMAKCHNGGLNWRKKTRQAKKNLDLYWKKFNNVRNEM